MTDSVWFVAYVRSCQERKIAERLATLGIEAYVPVHKVKRKWSDRIKMVDSLVLPGLVFVHTDEATRYASCSQVFGIVGYLMDRTNEVRKPLVVPDRQMNDFRRVVAALNGEEEIYVSDAHYEKGDTVRVIRGPFQGLVCECVEVQNKHRIIIRLGPIGSLLVEVKVEDVVKE